MGFWAPAVFCETRICYGYGFQPIPVQVQVSWVQVWVGPCWPMLYLCATLGSWQHPLWPFTIVCSKQAAYVHYKQWPLLIDKRMHTYSIHLPNPAKAHSADSPLHWHDPLCYQTCPTPLSNLVPLAAIPLTELLCWHNPLHYWTQSHKQPLHWAPFC